MTSDLQGDARWEMEQRLLGLQIKGEAGAAEFASVELRHVALSFEAPHCRIQLALLDLADAGHAVTITTIAAELGDYPAFLECGGIEYLRAMAGAAPVTTSEEDVRKRMAQTLRSWRDRQGAGPKVGCVKLVRGDSVEPEPIHWIWQDWLAQGKLHILAGQPGTGKTSIAIAIAATIAGGGLFPDGTRAPVGTAIIWSGEDGFRDTILPRFMACGGVREHIFHVAGRYDENCAPQPFDPAQDMATLVAAAAELPDLRFIILDPVVCVVPGDSHRNAEVRRAMQPLMELAERTGAAVMGLTHLTKGTAGREPLERITGSLAFGAMARLVWYTVKSKEQGDPSRLVRVKSNNGPDGGGFEYSLCQTVFDATPKFAAQTIQWGEVLEGSAKDLIAELEGPEDPGRVSALEAAKAWLPEFLGTGFAPVAFIQTTAKERGHAWATVLRAKMALGVESVKQGAKGWAWRMPKKINLGEDAQQ